MKLYNTLTRKIEEFKPIKEGEVGIYTCGPTVYNFAHLGNWRTYIFEDLFVRTLKFDGYNVKRVMNITDVGHLTADRDMGEDKIEKEAKKEQKTAWEIADFYTKAFQDDMKKLNLLPPEIWCKATDHIKEQIELVKTLEQKGFTYKTSDGIYFDTSKLSDYGKMATVDLANLKEGARVEKNPEKKSPTDFALWKFSPVGEKRQMEWDSPWGKGFPGWHLECSAMSSKYLGESFDIHTGAVDHINVHHTNEIAQSEAASGKKFVNFWLHGEFLLVNSGRMGKSEGNFITLQNLLEKGFHPLDFRYFTLGTHYRQQLNFTWESLEASKKAFSNLQSSVNNLRQMAGSVSSLSEMKLGKLDLYRQRFAEAVNNDLGIPQALAIVWELLKSEVPAPDKLDLLLDFDTVLGLNLAHESHGTHVEMPQKIQDLIKQREQLRKEEKFAEADQLRQEIEKAGFLVKDTSSGPNLTLRPFSCVQGKQAQG